MGTNRLAGRGLTKMHLSWDNIMPPEQLDGKKLTESEATAWLEKHSICYLQSDVPYHECLSVADDTVRRIRE